jgi:hypothetical protein
VFIPLVCLVYHVELFYEIDIYIWSTLVPGEGFPVVRRLTADDKLGNNLQYNLLSPVRWSRTYPDNTSALSYQLLLAGGDALVFEAMLLSK